MSNSKKKKTSAGFDSSSFGSRFFFLVAYIREIQKLFVDLTEKCIFICCFNENVCCHMFKTM